MLLNIRTSNHVSGFLFLSKIYTLCHFLIIPSSFFFYGVCHRFLYLYIILWYRLHVFLSIPESMGLLNCKKIRRDLFQYKSQFVVKDGKMEERELREGEWEGVFYFDIRLKLGSIRYWVVSQLMRFQVSTVINLNK